jgi:ribosome assembly protein YihI (activator of Der GTPase)
MQIDNKEFLAVKASDVAKVRMKLLDLIDKDIECYRKKKLAKTKELNDKELKELENEGVCNAIADVLENTREMIEEAFWIDQIGDLE